VEKVSGDVETNGTSAPGGELATETGQMHRTDRTTDGRVWTGTLQLFSSGRRTAGVWHVCVASRWLTWLARVLRASRACVCVCVCVGVCPCPVRDLKSPTVSRGVAWCRVLFEPDRRRSSII
jgi:hypothetical protein